LVSKNRFNSALDYFDSLEWDGIPRLDTMFPDYFRTEDTPLIRSVSAKFMIAAYRRIKKPGTKFDLVPIIEGDQGDGKSDGMRCLAGDEYFSDQSILDQDQKTQMELVQGKIIYELSELKGLGNTSIESVRAFISRTHDRSRPAYGRNVEEKGRTCVFVGTTSRSDYLTDRTGNRRFIPMRAGQVDMESIRWDRDQLFAEAVHREAEGESIALEPSFYAAAAEVQESRLDTLMKLEPEDVVDGEERISSNYILETDRGHGFNLHAAPL
jgi:predicted P-loop ATPase